MEEKEENPLDLIFRKNLEGETTEEFEDISKIPQFFEYIKNPQIEQKKKIYILQQIQAKFNVNRYLIEYFSSYENISIYKFLFDIFLLPDTTEVLKSEIINFISPLICNIETSKEIYEYIFQKLSIIYRSKEQEYLDPNEVNNVLKFLNAILGSTENCQKPRNYFCCAGNGQFIFDCNKEISIGNSFSVLINFKIGGSYIKEEDKHIKRISNLVNINFINDINVSIDLEYPNHLIIKDIEQNFKKILPVNEFTFLFITFIPIPQFNSIKIILNSQNSNNQIGSIEFEIFTKIPIKPNDNFISIEFFKKFYGEVTSIVIFSQKEEGDNGILNKEFMEEISKFKTGFWKIKDLQSFIKILKKYPSIEKEEKKEKKEKKDLKISILKKSIKVEEKKSFIYDDLISIFTPMNCYNTNTIEDYFGINQLIFNGDIRNHKYICYQKKLDLVCNLNNFLPIAEMFLIHKELLTEDNLELLLQIINNLIKDRTENIKSIKNIKFFKILRLFLEKYPNNVFTEKILNIFFEIGKNIFARMEKSFESLCANYFNYILLNEKILSKFSENLQVIFWNNIYKFCESDKSQIEFLININRLCLILRFYDKNKYTEMCCEEHLNAFKDDFIGSQKIMNPSMNVKLSFLNDIMNLIILELEPKKAVNLFKLLILDLSPCLTKFIINLFINAFEKDTTNSKDWTQKIIKELFEVNIQVIITNTFIHSLPEIRIDIIKFIYIIYQSLKKQKETKLFTKIENMIKTCLLPQKMFYENISYYPEKNEENGNENNNIIENKESQALDDEKIYNNNDENNTLEKMESSDMPQNYIQDENNINNININEIDNENINENFNEIDNENINEINNENINEIDNENVNEINNENINEIDNENINEIDNENVNENVNENINENVNENANENINEFDNENINEIDNENDNENINENVNENVNENANENINENVNENANENFNENINEFDNENINENTNENINKNINEIDNENMDENVKDNEINNEKDNENANNNDNENINEINKENVDEIVNDNENVNENNRIEQEEIIKEKDSKQIINENILVIKDEIYNEYLDALFCNFIDWIFDKKISSVDETETDIDTVIRNINGLELLSALNSEIKTCEFSQKFLNIINYLITPKGNAYILLMNNNIMNYLLDLSFNYFIMKNNQNNEENISDNNNLYASIKLSILNIFKNSLIYINEEKFANLFPMEQLEIFFIWATHLLKNDENLQTKETIFEFLSDMFFSLLNQFCELYNDNLEDIFLKLNINISDDFYIKNYLIMITKFFHFLFLFKLDSVIVSNGLSFVTSFSPKIDIPHTYLSSMRIDCDKGKNIEDYWIDYKFFNEFYLRVKYIWKMEKFFKEHNIKQIKKENKYDYILNNIILVKEKKNVYQKELEFLFFQEFKDEEENIISPMKIIIINLMNILFMANNSKNEEDMLYWLKEFKSFIKFVIISSSNLTKINQVELYNNIQKKCLTILSLGLCFMKNMVDTAIICKDKLKKYFTKIFNFCISIVYYQYNYNDNHKLGKKVFSFAIKASRNDLSNCAVVMLFTEYVKDSEGNALLSPKNKNIYLNQNEKILNLINTKEWKEALFENLTLKSEIDKNYFGLGLYEKTVTRRFFTSRELDDAKDMSYKTTILELLPKYEHELLKYSNNSFEKSIKVKSKYKKIKKQCFSWRGLWSDRNLFFGENGTEFKLKLVNHYTKNFMRPILVPILDINYYVPDFSNFDKNNLFKKTEESNISVNIDIDKILKSNEQNQLLLKNSNESFLQESDIPENYLRKIYTKSSLDLAENLFQISNKLDFGKEEEFTFLRKESKLNFSFKKIYKNYFLCCIVKPSHHIKGVCFIDEKQLSFKAFLNQKLGTEMQGIKIGFSNKDDDYDQERKTCFGSYFVCHPKDKDLSKIRINFEDIKLIFRRKYYYKNSGLEIYTTTNKSFYLNFKYEVDREHVLLEISNKTKNLVQIIDDTKDNNKIFGNILGYGNSLFFLKKKKYKKDKKIKVSKKIKEWKNWKISNFEFLMWLNIYSNRSYNDLSQYPVFPWILKNYTDPLQFEQNTEENIYRDLSCPMGMLEISQESIKRKELFMETYDTLKNDNIDTGEIDMSSKPYLFGSNYSNPVYVCNYLLRVFPFTHISIELQGNSFDNPDRMFLSVEKSFTSSTSQKTDVRELIPEFFYLPEMFINTNKLNLGFQEDGQEVNDVITPCNNNPYDFTMIMRNVLENDEVSNKINDWIDIIFGYKSKGKNAENANNLFTASSYQEDIDLKKSTNKESLLRLVEFGLIPNQIITKECTKRDKKEEILKEKEITDQNCNLKIGKVDKCKLNLINIMEEEKGKSMKLRKSLNKNNNNKTNISILKIGYYSDDKLTIFYNSDYFFEIKMNKATDKKINLDELLKTVKLPKIGNRMFNYQYPREYNEKICIFLDEGKSIILGGYYDGKIILIYTEPDIKIKQLVPFNEDIPICSIALSEDENYLFIGNKKGNIKIYHKEENDEVNLYEWIPFNKTNDQMSEISHINCNLELNLWCSASIDGYINIYSFPLCKLFRCIKLPTSICKYIFFSSCPLPSIIAICKEKSENVIYVYSINGKFLYKQIEQNSILSPNIIKDLNSYNYLVYICNNSICIRTLPNLIIQVLIEDLPGIYCIFTNIDKNILYATNRNGSEIYVIMDDS